jgi:UDP-GlcNAc3NAcA epimerase
MLTGIERVLEHEQPDVVVLYGDTNSTLAGALAAVKLHLPVAHVEAGLRSFNRIMPEEINRIASDHVSDLLLAPTPTAMHNLEREGLGARSVLTGDIMYDSVLHYRAVADRTSTILSRLQLPPGEYGMVTIHRAENTDDQERMAALLSTLNELAAKRFPLVFALHPRTAARLKTTLPGWLPHPRLQMIDPVGYLDSLALLANARVALTDSGGLQKEALFVGCPCVTLRAETEWVETLAGGANVLVGADPDRIRSAVDAFTAVYPRGNANFSLQTEGAFGRGDAAMNIIQALDRFHATSSATSMGAASGTHEREPEILVEGARA